MTRTASFHSLSLSHAEEGGESESHDLHSNTELLLDIYAFVGDMGFGNIARTINDSGIYRWDEAVHRESLQMRYGIEKPMNMNTNGLGLRSDSLDHRSRVILLCRLLDQ